MKIKFKRLVPEAVIPRKSHASDFCYDVVAVSEEEVAPNVWRYGLGFALQVDNDKVWSPNVRFAFDLKARSSVWKTGMVLPNGSGVIEEGYTGELCMVFYHVMPEMPRYKVGDRIGQLNIESTVPLDFVEVEELSRTDRGDGGFGSTGLARDL